MRAKPPPPPLTIFSNSSPNVSSNPKDTVAETTTCNPKNEDPDTPIESKLVCRLADYFAVIRPKGQMPWNIRDSEVIQRYPECDYPENKFPKNIELFCFPDGPRFVWLPRCEVERLMYRCLVCLDAMATRVSGTSGGGGTGANYSRNRNDKTESTVPRTERGLVRCLLYFQIYFFHSKFRT